MKSRRVPSPLPLRPSSSSLDQPSTELATSAGIQHLQEPRSPGVASLSRARSPRPTSPRRSSGRASSPRPPTSSTSSSGRFFGPEGKRAVSLDGSLSKRGLRSTRSESRPPLNHQQASNASSASSSSRTRSQLLRPSSLETATAASSHILTSSASLAADLKARYFSSTQCSSSTSTGTTATTCTATTATTTSTTTTSTTTTSADGHGWSMLVSVPQLIMISNLQNMFTGQCGRSKPSMQPNEYMDATIAQMKSDMKQRGLHEVSLPDQKTQLVELSEGRLTGLTNLSRRGDALLEAGTDHFVLSFALMAKDLRASYVWRRQRIKGEVAAGLEKVTMHMKIKQSVPATSAPRLLEFHVEHVDGLETSLQGLGPLNSVGKRLLRSLLRRHLRSFLEKECRTLIANELEHVMGPGNEESNLDIGATGIARGLSRVFGV